MESGLPGCTKNVQNLRSYSESAWAICALQETDNPDLRDRAYVYWRLLSSDPEAARSVVLAEKPVIAQDTSAMDPKLLQTLLGNLSTLSSVYHLPPSVSALASVYCLFQDTVQICSCVRGAHASESGRF